MLKIYAFLINFFFSESKWLSHYDQSAPCLGLKDGDYPVSDMFTYLHCSGGHASFLKCQSHYIFDANKKKCASHFELPTFCDNRPDGNYQNPWDCHKFIQCVDHKIHILSCVKGLVYDPYHDSCRDDLECHHAMSKFLK